MISNKYNFKMLNTFIIILFINYSYGDSIRPGDHISITRKINDMITYNHHGIYIGNNEVIHYTDESFNPLDAIIKKTSLKKFIGKSKKNTLIIIKYGDTNNNSVYGSAPFDSITVINRAYSRLGEQEYDLFKNNCEHFANYCNVGNSESGQINTIKTTLVEIRKGLDLIISLFNT